MMMKFFPKFLGAIFAAATTLAGQSLEEPTLEVDQGVGSFKWQSQQGRVYFLQFSTDLEEWDYFPSIIEPGNNQEKEWMFSTAPNPKLFTRLRHTQSNSLTPEFEDFDGDGYTNFFELQISASDPLDGSNPGSLDLDGNGISDEYEYEFLGGIGSDPQGDYDGDGVTNIDEFLAGTNGAVDDSPEAGGANGDMYSGLRFITEKQNSFDHTGVGADGVKTSDSELLYTGNGSSSFFVLVGIHSAEYPEYTDPTCTIEVEGNEVPCEFNDIVNYKLDVIGTDDEISPDEEINVNDLDDEWDDNSKSKSLDIGEGLKYYYFIEKEVIENSAHQELLMNAEVEVTNINDAQYPSGATIAVFPVQIEPEPTSEGQVGDLILSVNGESGQKHFVSTKKNPHLDTEFIEFKVSGISEEIFDEFLEWEGGEAVEGSSLQRKVSRGEAAHTELKVKIKGSGKVVDTMNVWTVWTLESGSVLDAQSSDSNNKNNKKVGEFVVAPYSCDFFIRPSSIITAEERPNLAGENATAPPGGNDARGVALAKGVQAKWDVSRRIKRVMNNNINPPFSKPSPLDKNINFPTDSLIGNDDSNINLEKTNPYDENQLGKLESGDTPSRGFTLDGGNINSTYQNSTSFQEFARLEIRGQWYLISDDEEWGVTWKMKKEKIPRSEWFGDPNLTGFLLESDANQDLNGDGQVSGPITRWVDNGSESTN